MPATTDLADRPTLDDVHELVTLVQAEVAADRAAVDRLADEVKAMAGSVAEATEATISKSDQLRRLMDQAADGLDALVGGQAKRAAHQRMEPGEIASIVRAAAVLRTVAIYIADA